MPSCSAVPQDQYFRRGDGWRAQRAAHQRPPGRLGNQLVVGTSPSYTSLGSCVSPKQQSPRTVTRLPHSKPPKLEFQAFGPRLPNKVPHQVSPSAGTSVWPLRLQFYGVVSFRHSGLRFSVDFGLACRFRIWGHWLVKGGWLRFQHALPDSVADLFASRIASVPRALNG